MILGHSNSLWNQVLTFFDKLSAVECTNYYNPHMSHDIDIFFCFFRSENVKENISKSCILWEGHKILRDLHQLFDWQYIGQIIGGDLAKFYGLLEYMNFKVVLLYYVLNVPQESIKVVTFCYLGMQQ